MFCSKIKHNIKHQSLPESFEMLFLLYHYYVLRSGQQLTYLNVVCPPMKGMVGSDTASSGCWVLAQSRGLKRHVTNLHFDYVTISTLRA